MDDKDGLEYEQNYDVIVKWMTEVLRGGTLDFMGLSMGIIADVFAFEPTDISVKAGRVDIMVRNEHGDLYHIEEQRDLGKSDMYRFAAYHFLGSKKWGDELTDIIIASGDVYAGKKEISTNSGKYRLIVVDLTERNGWERLQKIRRTARDNDPSGLLELVFIPLYGKEKGPERQKLAVEVFDFETELVEAGKMDIEFVAATLIMANKIIDKAKLNELWEVIKMLDILKLAKEKGEKEGIRTGIQTGIQTGEINMARGLVIEALEERFQIVPITIIDKVKAISRTEILKSLHKQAIRCSDVDGFNEVLAKAAQ